MNCLVSILIVLCAKEISGEMYLAAGFTSYLLAAAGQREGTYTVHYPGLGLSESRRLTSFYTDTFSVGNSMMTTAGVEDKSILVNASHGDVSIQGESDYNVFNLLSVPDLGTRHVVSSCLPVGGTSVLVVATHQYQTSIRITFQMKGTINHMGKIYGSGDTLRLDLASYQTYTMKNSADISGTLVVSTESVGVFVGAMHRGQSKVLGYHQLPPVRLHGQDYMVVTSTSSPRYYLQIATEHDDTTIIFHNKTSLNVGVDGIFKTSLGPNENIRFTTSRPVMTTMCLQNEKSSVIVPPISSFTNQHILFYPGDAIKIMTVKDNKDLSVIQASLPSLAQASMSNVAVIWEEMPDKGYKIGTCKIPDSPYSSTVITSSSNFGILGFDGNYLFSGKDFKAGVATSPTTFYSKTATCPNDKTTIIVGAICGLVMLLLFVGNIIFAFRIYQRKQGNWRRITPRTDQQITDTTAPSDVINMSEDSTGFSNPAFSGSLVQ